MKKLVQLFVMLALVLTSVQVAFANDDKVTLQEGADITFIHRLAVGQPLYYQTIKTAPTKEELCQIVYDASKVARSYVISYDEVSANVQKDTGIDIKSLDRRAAAKAYKENVGKYVDAYVILTVANNSRTVFFFDVFKAGTNELLYTYEIHANRSEKDTAEVYRHLSEQFYKNFERSATDQLKAKK